MSDLDCCPFCGKYFAGVTAHIKNKHEKDYVPKRKLKTYYTELGKEMPKSKKAKITKKSKDPDGSDYPMPSGPFQNVKKANARIQELQRLGYAQDLLIKMGKGNIPEHLAICRNITQTRATRDNVWIQQKRVWKQQMRLKYGKHWQSVLVYSEKRKREYRNPEYKGNCPDILQEFLDQENEDTPREDRILPEVGSRYQEDDA